MFTPTKAACHHTKVANAVSAVQTADVVLSISHLNGKQSDTTHLLHAAGELQLRPPEDQLAGWGPVQNLCFSQQTAEQGSVSSIPPPPDSLKSMSIGESRLGLGVFGLLLVRLGMQLGGGGLSVCIAVWCDSPLQYKEVQGRPVQCDSACTSAALLVVSHSDSSSSGNRRPLWEQRDHRSADFLQRFRHYFILFWENAK